MAWPILHGRLGQVGWCSYIRQQRKTYKSQNVYVQKMYRFLNAALCLTELITEHISAQNSNVTGFRATVTVIVMVMVIVIVIVIVIVNKHLNS